MSSVAFAASPPETREYLLGDIDNFTYNGQGSVDDVYVSPDWLDYVNLTWMTDKPYIYDFDFIASTHSPKGNYPFTFVYELEEGEVVVGATLSLGLRATGTLVSTDAIFLDEEVPDDPNDPRNLWFDDLGWLPLPETGTNTRTLDLGNVLGNSYLPFLQDSELNVLIRDDTAVDYAILTIEVVPEPATLSLLTVGAVALMRRWRK